MKMKDGLIVPGARHFSPDMREVLKRIYGVDYHLKVETQGFMDQRGAFLTREEALPLARANGQIRREVGNGGQLFSEHLY